MVDGLQGKIKGVKSETGTYTANNTKASFYLVPQSTAGITLKISIGNDTKSLTLDKLLEQLGSAQPELNGSKRCTLTLKVSREESLWKVVLSMQGNQVTADGEVIIG